MDQSEMEGICQRQVDDGGEEGYQGTALVGGEWIRISYERRDGWIQVQYILFGPGGYVHSVFDGILSPKAERWHNDVYSSSRDDYGINRVGLVSRAGWDLWRMVGEMDASRAGRLVNGTRFME